MPQPPVRINDPVACDLHGDGHVVSADATVTFEGQLVARAGDKVKYKDTVEKPIEEGSACVMVNGQRLALVNDNAEENGTLKSGASTIQVDEGDPFVFIGPNVHVGKNVSFVCGAPSELSNAADVVLGVVTMVAGIPEDEVGVGEVVQIAGFNLTKHALERMTERKVTKEAIEDALKNLLKVNSPKVGSQGRISQRYIGRQAEVAVNPENKNIVSVNPTSSKVVEKFTLENNQ